MVVNLFKLFYLTLPFPVWVLTLILILVWWLLTWGIAKLLIKQRVRPPKVIYSAQMVLFLAGAIFVFNVTMVPVVLIAFHGMALYALWICSIAAILYFFRVGGKDQESLKGSSRGYIPPPSSGRGGYDPFK